MRTFSSYGPINAQSNYYAPRTELIERACTQLAGEHPAQGGHYITVWAPRQSGKTWIMLQTLFRLRDTGLEEWGDIVKLNVQSLEGERHTREVVRYISEQLSKHLKRPLPESHTLQEFEALFSRDTLQRPLILILDEFDSLPQDTISALVGTFLNIYINRQEEGDKRSEEKSYLLHGVALIGVRSVLGIENVRGSPFNVQRSLHIPNLNYEEVEGIFRWYERESDRQVDREVIRRIYFETRGQPGLTCWLGELLSEGFDEYQPDRNRDVTPADFDEAYAAAVKILPNSNILNLISKAKQPSYKDVVFELLRTDTKMEFTYDDPSLNYLYMNGVIDRDKVGSTDYYARFASPFVQKRLFNAFARELFGYMGKLYEPFEDFSDTFMEQGLNIRNLLRRHERHLKANRDWLLKDAPKRKDLRIYEAVYHFNLYMFLHEFLKLRDGRVYPEFPTGNGKIDLIIRCQEKKYGIEVKSYTDDRGYRKALSQAASYSKELALSEISLVFFVEYIDQETRERYETTYEDRKSCVTVFPTFVETGR